MSLIKQISLILVPQGAEYSAVRRGINQVSIDSPLVNAIPIGIKPLTRYLCSEHFLAHYSNCTGVLMMGLCGSLKPDYQIGDIVVYQEGLSSLDGQISSLPCDPSLTSLLFDRLQDRSTPKVKLVSGWTSDRIIHSATEKLQLGQTYDADVVDMEGFAALEFFRQLDIPISIVRVVSDNVMFDLPDLNQSIVDGAIRPFPLAIRMLRQPLGAIRLIRGSLQSLRVLQQVSKSVFS